MYRHPAARAGQLIISCVVLGVGVGLVLSARLGSDGYSSLINGIVRTTGVSYALVSPAIGLTFVLAAWSRGVRPGVGTLTHPVIVGLTVHTVLDHLATPQTVLARTSLLLAGALVLAVGVAGYLDTDLGKGPFEAATFALRPIPFRLAYNGLQALAAVTGWVLGADVGIGTLVVVFGVGPTVHILRNQISHHRSPRMPYPNPDRVETRDPHPPCGS